jgi:DNA-binding NarL/FixJ family response regulator
LDARVFLVDDATKVRGTLADLLRTIGGFHIVGSAATEAEANLWLDEHPGGWDLAVIDLMLEQGAGLSVIARCRAQAHPGKIVVFSGYATPGVRKRCMDLGADAVFDKAQVEPLMAFFRGIASSPESA